MIARFRRLRAISHWFSLALLAMCAGCGRHDVTVTFDVVDGYAFSSAERRAIQDVADTTAIEVRKLLPLLPQELIIRVRSGKRVIAETGETGETTRPNIVYWTVDPGRPGGVLAIVKSQLRASLFHEFHHLVRGLTIESTSLMDHVVTEGMATVLERDFAGASPPWGAYPADVSTWVTELMALPPDTQRSDWLIRHPDGRRWIGMKAGAYLVDQATKKSGRSAAALVSTSTDEVITTALR